MKPEASQRGILSAEKLELLKRLLGEEEDAFSRCVVPRRPQSGPAPLSLPQRRLWFLDRWQPRSPLYNISSAFALSGSVDVPALFSSCREIALRHEILRTTFRDEGGEPVQWAAREVDLRPIVADLAALPTPRSRHEVDRLAFGEARRGLDLVRGPLWRLTLLRQSPEEHTFLLTLHHIASDGWSTGVLMRELASLYGTFSRGHAPVLPELPIQYADFAVWQHRRLESGELDPQLDYWRHQLEGAPALLDLPTDHPRPPAQGPRGATVGPCPLGHDPNAGLAALARQNDATLFVVLLAAFFALLHRYTGAEDLVVGSPFANRVAEETEGLIGFFVNTLPLRARPTGGQSFRALLAAVREVALGAFDHQELPLEALFRALQVPRSPSHAPLFQVVLAVRSDPPPALLLPGLTLVASDLDTGTAKFDLMLSLTATERDCQATVEYRSELFEAATAGRLIGHLTTLLHGITTGPDRAVGELPLLTEVERNQLTIEWNRPTAAGGPGECLHRRFEGQAGLAPDAVAVVMAEGEFALTYGELSRRADRLARGLRRLGAGPETTIGLWAGATVEAVVGILAVLKAGGAYVPLDPAYPAERLALLLAGAGASIVLAPAEAADRLPAATRLILLDPEDPAAAENDDPEGDLPDRALPDAAAYVLHTSGSTGRPKGVVVSHRNVTRLFRALAQSMDFGATGVWSVFHSFSFDFSVWELWGALLHGGKAVLIPREVARSPATFAQVLRREQVTVLSQTPSAFQSLARDATPAGEPFAALERVIFGGEALDLPALAPWLERRNDRRPQLVNLYGITETTVHATWRPLRRTDSTLAVSRIGRPLADLRLYLIDRFLGLVPAGIPGEICVAGPGVARGYLGDPSATAERFLPDPWGGIYGEPGGRMYRSGDLARYREGGDLEYLGRRDFQVKLRGYRIEPGEIEAVLAGHPAVSAAVVRVRQDDATGRRLVAYCVAADGKEAPTVRNLRAFARQRLPEPMVPAAFVVLDRLPLTDHGKLDRAALPAPGPERPDQETAYVAPRTESEEVLAHIWAQVLGLDRVGVTDNFFALGGDSMLSLRVHAFAAERGLRFSLPQLFACQTVAALVQEVERTVESPTAGSPAPFSMISPEDRRRLPPGIEDAYPVSAVQGGMLYHMRYTPTSIVYHNVYSRRLRAPFDPEAFARAAQRVVDRHPILRTSFDLTTYGEPLQLVHETAAVAVGADDLSRLSPPEQEVALDAFVEDEKQKSFNLARPPLVRFHLHRRDAESFNLTFTEFHPVFDGWSLHSFLAEVLAAYLALAGGRPAPAAGPLRLAVRDFVALERAAAESAECRAFWARNLEGAKPFALFRRGGGIRPDGVRIRAIGIDLSDPVEQGLRRLARRSAVPQKSVLLTAHLEAMSRIGGGPEVMTGLVTSGRPEGFDGDRVLGLFFNVVPFRAPASGSPADTWVDRVRRTFAAEREMLPFRRYPLPRIQQSQGGKPLFEVLFNFIHFHVLRDLLDTGQIELMGDSRRWEETNIPLSTTFVQDPGSDRLRLVLRYDGEQLAPWYVEGLGGIYRQVLSAMALAPLEPCHALRSLEPAAEHQLLTEWSGAGTAPPPEVTLPELYAAQVSRTPDAIAAVCEEEALSYRHLAARVLRLARRLRRAGVGPEVRVGISMPRGLDLVVALLGVLEAGGAYVPLDPTLPRERIGVLLAEAGISLVLVREAPEPELLPTGLAVLEIGAGAATEGAEANETTTGRSALAGAAAYVLFTSGSTGAPKGVVVEHRALATYVAAVVERLDPPDGASYAMASTFAADLGNTAIFPSLLTGGCLEILTEERTAGAEPWEEIGRRRPVDVLKIVPSHLSALLSSPGAAAILPRARLVLGGEPLDPKLVSRVYALAPDVQVFNHYGPTEATVGVTCGRADPDGAGTAGGATVPVGRPLKGVRIYLLQDGALPVPPGAPGELCIGGATLARGYLGRPDATAERFVPDPFAPEPGARLYLTGDQARWLPDGRIELLGRRDGQVKIRGFRVELQELEQELALHPGVRESAAAVRQDRAGERRLVAYLVPSGEDLPADRELRTFLRRRLTEYMLPAGFVRLDELPRTRNGKLDRAALPEAADLLGAWRSGSIAPRNELEHAIAAVWQEVLGVAAVGVEDNLFDLGGHSLIMLRIHSKLRRTIGRDLPMTALFEYPTIGDLARHLIAPQAAEPDAVAWGEARHAALEGRRRPDRRPSVGPAEDEPRAKS
ncbi:MAG TPA: amino acid adenylation domain-containing protein [Thermoanaerobaculia bacterium]|jgi:amino acid adenylation domain-containing protein|nr:amino acid adenylation domain-containing protein [Thermoanaerobaculia bacterium]